MKGKKGETKMIGGVTPSTKPGVLVSGNPKVAAEAKAYKDGGTVDGKKSAMRLDRPGRKRGGRVGADCTPLSSAASTSGRSDGKGTN